VLRRGSPLVLGQLAAGRAPQLAGVKCQHLRKALCARATAPLRHCAAGRPSWHRRLWVSPADCACPRATCWAVGYRGGRGTTPGDALPCARALATADADLLLSGRMSACARVRSSACLRTFRACRVAAWPRGTPRADKAARSGASSPALNSSAIESGVAGPFVVIPA